MTWESVWNISKLLGYLIGAVGFIALVAKVWSSTTKDKFIELLEKELGLAREHVEQSDKDARHYREEMHSVRKECQGKISETELGLTVARQRLKEVEIANAKLSAQTDLTPVMQSLTTAIKEQRAFTEEQTLINSQVLSALQQLNAKIA